MYETMHDFVKIMNTTGTYCKKIYKQRNKNLNKGKYMQSVVYLQKNSDTFLIPEIYFIAIDGILFLKDVT